MGEDCQTQLLVQWLPPLTKFLNGSVLGLEDNLRRVEISNIKSMNIKAPVFNCQSSMLRTLWREKLSSSVSPHLVSCWKVLKPPQYLWTKWMLLNFYQFNYFCPWKSDYFNQILNMSMIWFPHHKNTFKKNDLFLLIPFPSWNDASKAENPETTRLRMEFQILQQTQLWPQMTTPTLGPWSSIPHWCFLDILAGGNKK